MIRRILLVLDDKEMAGRLRRRLTDADTLVETVKIGSFRLEKVSASSANMLVISRGLVPDPWTDTVRVLQELPELPAIVILCAGEDAEQRAQLLAAGCDAVLNESLPLEELTEVLEAVLAKRREVAERGIAERIEVRPSLKDFISSSATMRAFMSQVERVVRSDVTLLIQGETGVGKERLASAIHYESVRSEGPLVAVNCGAFPETLLESELFGHEKGAFTGATRSRRGCFELAHGGTLFLDEICEMPFHLQVKLLRALQEREIQRIGAERPLPVDVRVIAASNLDLVAAIEAERFRRDLYYRLSVVKLTIPPLRERRADIPDLVASYLAYLKPRVGRNVTGVTDGAMEALGRYDWPGNVRELINVIERAMLLCEGEQITVQDFPEEISSSVLGESIAGLLDAAIGGHLDPGSMPAAWHERPLREVRDDLVKGFERAYLCRLLELTKGRVGETAQRAGLQPRSLFSKMRAYGLRKEDFRPGRRRLAGEPDS